MGRPNRPLIDIVGQTYGRLVVVRETDRAHPLKRRFTCQCACGTSFDVNIDRLRTGHTKSCGCLHTEVLNAGRKVRPIWQVKHGLSHTLEYRSWVGMRDRCSNPANKGWRYYGGRGITVCQEWFGSFNAFLDHIGPRPTPKHSVDRIDVNGNYEPGNVRWATPKQQAANTRAALARAAVRAAAEIGKASHD